MITHLDARIREESKVIESGPQIRAALSPTNNNIIRRLAALLYF